MAFLLDPTLVSFKDPFRDPSSANGLQSSKGTLTEKAVNKGETPFHLSLQEASVSDADDPEEGLPQLNNPDAEPAEEPAPQAPLVGGQALQARVETALQCGARLLQKRFGQGAGMTLSACAQSEGVSKHVLRARLEAAAEANLQKQEAVHMNVLRYIHARVALLRPVAYVERCSYDATPLTIRVPMGQSKEKLKSKIFVTEMEWCALVAKREVDDEAPASENYLVIRGAYAVQARVAERGTGESVCNLHLATQQLPPPPSLRIFRDAIRVAESDEDGANVRGERLLKHCRAKSHSELFLLHCFCSAHKVHSSAESVWELSPNLISAIIHCCKLLQDPVMIRALRTTLREEIRKRVQVYYSGGISPQATHFRNEMTKHFLPPLQHVRRRLAMQQCLELLNGDMRGRELSHYCKGPSCCHNAEHTVAKLQHLLPQALLSQRPTMFSRNNWSSWHLALNFFGWAGGLHSLLQDCLSKVIASKLNGELDHLVAEPGDVEQDDVPDAVGADLLGAPDAGPVAPAIPDPYQQERQENLARLRFLTTWIPTGWFQELWLLRVALEPQVQLMKKTLWQSSTEYEIVQCKRLQDEGRREHRVVSLLLGRHLKEMYAASLEHVVHAEAWVNTPFTEQERSRVLQFCMRAPGVVFQLLTARFSKYPWSLFRLLVERCRAVASQILRDFATKPCLMDPFTTAFLQHHNTEEDLLSEDTHQLLGLLGSMLQTNTFGTERAHSRHARRARQRSHAPPVDLPWLGLEHAAYAGMAPLVQCARQTQQVRDKDQRGRAVGRPQKKRKFEDVEAGAPFIQHRRRRRVKPHHRAGGGGAWRAFCHIHTDGKLTAEGMRALAIQYRSLDAPAKQRYSEIGRLGPVCQRVHVPACAPLE